MINSISERRVKLNDKYKLYLEVPEKEYLMIYNDDVSVENARDVTTQYLRSHQDDAVIDSINVKHDKNNHSINIEADLNYIGNEYTSYRDVPTYLKK